MYYIQNPLSNRDAVLDEIARRYGYEYQRRKYVETYPYINSVYGSNDIRIRELVERYGVNGTPYIPNPKTISIGNITSNGIILPQDLNSGIARLSAVRGKSLVWNQSIATSPAGNIISYGGGALVLSRDNDGRFHLNGSITSDTFIYLTSEKIGGTSLRPGTKSILSFISVSGSHSGSSTFSVAYTSIYNRTIETNKFYFNPVGQNAGYLMFNVKAGDVFDDFVFIYNIFDLTLMFGEGKEPSTVEEFEAMYPLPYYDYNPGTIINNNASAIESIGFNQWDEEWETGSISGTTGENVPSSSNIRSSNYYAILPAVQYYAKCSDIWIAFYDSQKNFIVREQRNNQVFTSPSNAAYFRFVCGTIYGTTYNHDICINISNTFLNGTYKPYKKDTLTLNLSTIKGKLNGEGEGVIIFPNGMRSAGTAYDYLIVDADGYARKAVKVMESVDLGTLEYTMSSGGFLFTSFYVGKLPKSDSTRANILCERYEPSSANEVYYHRNVDKVIGYWSQGNGRIIIFDSSYTDAATFKAAMNGVMLNYELATPQEYVLDEPIYTFFEVEKGGILRAKYNDSEQVHAPLDIDLIYSEAK